MATAKNAEAVLRQAKKIDVADDWFDVIKLPRNVYAIAEPGHWQHVISYSARYLSAAFSLTPGQFTQLGN